MGGIESYHDGQARIFKLELGPFSNNGYILVDAGTGEGAIVDAPPEGERLLAAAPGVRISSILITHGHADHLASLGLLKDATGAPVMAFPGEPGLPPWAPEIPLEDGSQIAIGGLLWRVLHTPGHTPGSLCFSYGRHLIAGDTLFPGGPGHSDSPQDLRQEIDSIVSKLYVLPDNTIVCPGHGPNTTIGRSRAEYAVFASRPHPPDLCGDVLWKA